MTAPAFQATFADFRLIKGRKVAQFIFELPIEAADAALETLGGVPRPDKECWVAVARIDPTKATSALPEPAKGRREWSELSYAQQAGIRCNEPRFWQFLNSIAGAELSSNKITSPEGAASFVRIICGVASRADIKPGTRAGEAWERLNEDWNAWNVA